MVRVSTGARIHFGLLNLGLARDHLYDGAGVVLDEPQVVAAAEPASGVQCRHPATREYAEQAVKLLSVEGVDVSVERTLPRHTGLGSGTQLALAVLRLVAVATGREADVRRLTPEMDRGGCSGVGVAMFEAGGAVLDAGHPTARLTTDRPEDGSWSVLTVAARHEVPDRWRFLLVVPNADPGRNGAAEESSMRSVIERAGARTGDRIAGIITRRFLPALAKGFAERFGEAVESVGRLNGTWYANEQGGVYRPPVGALTSSLSELPIVYGAGQSSWGPTVYGVTDADRVDEAVEAGRAALFDADIEGTVSVARGRNRGASTE